MIYCLVTAAHAYTWHTFLGSWGKPLTGRVTVLTYKSLLTERLRHDPKGAYLFCDLDRLPLRLREQLASLHSVLCDLCGSERVLNHPLRSMQRYDVLRTLHAAGLNRFGAQWLRPREVPKAFPVLIREERGCIYAQLPLLSDEAQYHDAVAALRRAKSRLDDLLTVEFCDTADADGVYRKYGAFIVGSNIVPRHVFFSRNWMVKRAELADQRYLEEERAYIAENPHAEVLGRIARIAGITYGRIDYALLEGRVQTWEINTNPMIASTLSEQIPERASVTRGFVELFDRALATLERH